MEKLEVKQFADVYRNKRVLITGHTGFKGSWLSLWLTQLGAKVSGVALSPESQSSHWDQLKLSIIDKRVDIRDLNSLRETVASADPEIVFHLAAQPLVRRSYRDPIETWSTNVMGTANLLESCRSMTALRAIVIVTSDKCYENREWHWGYRETDHLGGYDPYSASKAGVELLVASYRNSFFNDDKAPLLATARAGNVIGGGDWSEDRLIPDLIRAIEKDESLEIRSPYATRPWQHVLESLSGYLLLGQKLLSGERACAQAWNFGPEIESNQTVIEVLTRLNQLWGCLNWHVGTGIQPHESNFLYLDSSKAQKMLGWKPIWNISESLKKTALWYQSWMLNEKLISVDQLQEYIDMAAEKNLIWTCQKNEL